VPWERDHSSAGARRRTVDPNPYDPLCIGGDLRDGGARNAAATAAAEDAVHAAGVGGATEQQPMASDVTMKDLQSLQGYCNKQIADVKKSVAETGKGIDNLGKMVSQDNGLIVDINHRIDGVDRKVAALQDSISALTAEIKALKSRAA
jgi:peptidoglycan hydrolase CwlO-like protein